MKFIFLTSLCLTFLYASFYNQGQDFYDEQNYAQAKSSFENGCKKNEFESCEALGGMYKFGLGVNKSYANAEKYYNKACELSVKQGEGGIACSGLSYMRESGIIVGSEKDDENKLIEMVNSCEVDNDADSCLKTAEWIRYGRGYLEGYDDDRPFIEKSCSYENYKGCALFSKVEKNNNNIGKARYFAELSCVNNEPSGCITLGELMTSGYNIEHNEKKSGLKAYLKACLTLNDAEGCSLAAMFIENESGVKNAVEKAQPYKEKAKILFLKSCDEGNMESCFLGGMNMMDENPKNAVKLLEKACKNKNKMACDNLGNIYLNGMNTIKSDKKKAISALKNEL